MQITNIMSVDLEDYYCDLPFSKWPKYESRIIKNTEMILDLFEKSKELEKRAMYKENGDRKFNIQPLVKIRGKDSQTLMECSCFNG